MEISCPHCGVDIIKKSKYCSSCSRLANDFKICEKCCEPVSINATICAHCSSTFKSDKEKTADNLELEVRATKVGALFGGNVTALFLPPIIKVSNGRITVTKWSLFGLRRHIQEIQVGKVASVRYTKGVFWGGIMIETFGGAAEDLNENGLRQEDARTMAEQLKGCLKD